MSSDASSRGFLDVFDALLRVPPVPRVVSGIVGVAGGAVLTVFLWDKGVIWGLSIFAIVAGVFLLGSGLVDLRRQKKRREMLAAFQRKRGVILNGMLEAKRQGRNPIRFLNEQGIHDAEMRGSLIEEMNERLKSRGPGAPSTGEGPA